MTLPARETLVVFRDGDEVPGITVYGLMPPGGWTGGDFPYSSWPPGTETEESHIFGKDWEVILWDVALPAWPRGDAWRQAVHDTLAHVVSGGCLVSWLGAEGLPFSDPPDLFCQDQMSDAVLAAMTSAGDYECAADPDKPLAALPPSSLTRLRGHSRGLADAT